MRVRGQWKMQLVSRLMSGGLFNRYFCGFLNLSATISELEF